MKRFLFITLLALVSCQLEEAVAPNNPDVCTIAGLTVHPNNVKLNIYTKADVVWIKWLYQDYYLTSHATPDQYDCIGFSRREHDYYITVWNDEDYCILFVPKLTHNE